MSVKHLGRYEITGTLGRGAMGVVYRAHDPFIDRTVAIKTISYAGLTPAEAEEFESRFYREAKSAGRLNHPNIVTIHDVGRSDELAYIAMEFLDGQSLRAVLDSGVVLSVRRIVKIASAVANGLAFAHDHGIVHRDIKPANIMVLDTGIVKIADFGIALLPSGAQTLEGSAVGSPKYMAPEQVRGRKADGRSDIFSLGAVLYEMLTGHPPFSGADLNAILYQVLNAAPPLPSSVNVGLPKGFDRIVARALAKDPDKRYQSAAEMASDLRNHHKMPGLMQGSGKVDSSTPSSVDSARRVAAKSVPSGRTIKSSPAIRSKGLRFGLVALLVVMAGGVYVWQNRQSQTEAARAAVVEFPIAAAPVVEPKAEAQVAPEVAGVMAQKTAMEAEPVPPVASNLEHVPEVTGTEMAESSAPVAADKAKLGIQAEKATLPDIEIGKRTPVAKSAPKPIAKKPASEAVVPTPSPGIVEQTHVSVVPAANPSAPDWKGQLRAELALCESSSFLSRVICREKARWKYCPGHWGAINECPGQKSQQPVG